jgi:peroxiredoxin Q/BCP
LRQNYQAFVERDTEILVIGPENKTTFSNYWQKENLPFVGLPDPNHDVSDKYGQQVKWLKLGRLPALAVVDKQGQIRYQHYGSAMWDISDNETLLALLDQLNQANKEAA